jgi:hypothetical protein
VTGIWWTIWLAVTGGVAREARADWRNPDENRAITVALVAVIAVILGGAAAVIAVWG